MTDIEYRWLRHFRLTIPLNDPIVLGILQDLWCNFEIKQNGYVMDHSARHMYAGELDDWECQLADRFHHLKKQLVRDQKPDDSVDLPFYPTTLNSPHQGLSCPPDSGGDRPFRVN